MRLVGVNSESVTPVFKPEQVETQPEVITTPQSPKRVDGLLPFLYLSVTRQSFEGLHALEKGDQKRGSPSQKRDSPGKKLELPVYEG